MQTADLAVLVAYLGVVLGIGVRFSAQSGAGSFFLGEKSLPWWVAMSSLVATETSALTVLSLPGIGAGGDLKMLQLPLGYILGRIAVAVWILPKYFSGEQPTAYAFLEARFGLRTRQVASLLFVLIRILGDTVRVFATAIPLTLLTGWHPTVSITALVLVTLVYSLMGGIRAVVWSDAIQLGIYIVGGIIAMSLAAEQSGGFGAAWAAAAAEGKLQMLDLNFSWASSYTLWSGVVGGALLSVGSHGTDQVMVQRLLGVATLNRARLALIGSGFLVLGQFAFFLLVGTLIWSAGANVSGANDEIYARFVIDAFPPGWAGLAIAGILSAAMSSASSSINSLASVTVYDFYLAVHPDASEERLLRAGRISSVGWGVLLAVGACLYRSDQPAVEIALSFASIVYGALVGLYALALFFKGSTQYEALIALVSGTLSMAFLVLGKPGAFAQLGWPWYVPLGTGLTLLWGLLGFAVRAGFAAEPRRPQP